MEKNNRKKDKRRKEQNPLVSIRTIPDLGIEEGIFLISSVTWRVKVIFKKSYTF